MILNNAAELLSFEMSSRSLAPLMFIILIPEFNYKVGQLSTHVGTH